MFANEIAYKHSYLHSPYECSWIAKGRNHVWKLAKEHKVDWFVTIDSDTVFNPGTLTRLMEMDKPIASGVIYMRRPPYLPCIHNFDDNGNSHPILNFPKDVPFKVDAVGCGFTVFRKDVIEGMPDNPFNNTFSRIGEIQGEDISFMWKAKELGFEVWIDPTLDFGHKGSMIVTRNHFEYMKKVEEEKNGVMV